MRKSKTQISWDDRRIDLIHFIPASVGYEISPYSNVCSVIAVSFALNISFDDAYERMMFEGYEQHMLLNTIPVISAVLGTKHISCQKSKWCNTLDFITFGPPSQHPESSYLIHAPQHIFHYARNTIYDGQIRTRKNRSSYYVFDNRENRIRYLQREVIGYYEINIANN